MIEAYYDESGNSTIRKDGLFVVVGFWTYAPKQTDTFMRRWYKKLKLDGYQYQEIKGYHLNAQQRADGFSKMKDIFGDVPQIDATVVHMNSLMSDYKLFHPKKCKESDIHQAALHESFVGNMTASKETTAKILVDPRHTLPKSFFERTEKMLRNRFSTTAISVTASSSQQYKGIQFVDVICNACYNAVRATSTENQCDARELISTVLPFPISVRTVTTTDLLSALDRFQNNGE